MKKNVHIYSTPEELANKFADLLMNIAENSSGNSFNMAISGGRTPDLLFSELSAKYADSGVWEKIHFWWVDERMVSPEHPESNFGRADKLLFSQIHIPSGNIHRIKGENDPKEEALSYSTQIKENIPERYNWPNFDMILLGMGDDGHTASIFPNQLELLESDRICAVASHPESGQKRITLTGKAINNAQKIYFLVTGANKAERISEIWNNPAEAIQLPAFHITPKNGELIWFADKAATRLL